MKRNSLFRIFLVAVMASITFVPQFSAPAQAKATLSIAQTTDRLADKGDTKTPRKPKPTPGPKGEGEGDS